jgi:hypothetical protein
MTTTTRRREGCYVCQRCEARHANAGLHDDGAHVGLADLPGLARQILEAFAAIPGHMSAGVFLCVDSPVNPQPPGPRLDLRTREGRAWIERQLEVQGIMRDLEEAGYLEEVDEPCGARPDADPPEPGYPWGLAITGAGRAYLAEEGSPS